MGAKSLPPVKDQKAGQRFQQMQHTQSKFIKPSAKSSAPKATKKK